MISFSFSEKVEGIIEIKPENSLTFKMPINFEVIIAHSDNQTTIQIRDYTSNSEVIQYYNSDNNLISEQKQTISQLEQNT